MQYAIQLPRPWDEARRKETVALLCYSRSKRHLYQRNSKKGAKRCRNTVCDRKTHQKDSAVHRRIWLKSSIHQINRSLDLQNSWSTINLSPLIPSFDCIILHTQWKNLMYVSSKVLWHFNNIISLPHTVLLMEEIYICKSVIENIF